MQKHGINCIYPEIDIDFIVKSAPGYIYWKNLDSVYIGCNQNVVDLIGLKEPFDIVGKTDYQLPWNNMEVAAKAIKDDKEVISTGKKLITEDNLGIKNSKGLVIVLRTEKTPLIDSKGNIVGVLAISLDITDTKEAERLKLENSIIEEKMQFAKVMAISSAHELRTPLSSISLIADQLESLGQSPFNNSIIENIKAFPSKLRKIIQAINTFIDMTLMKANFEKTKSVVLKELSAVKSIKEAIHNYPLHKTEKILIKMDSLEDISKDFQFLGDQILFNHIMFNLIKNALYYIRYADKGEIYIWISKEKEFNIINFKDTGKGMPQAVLNRIFDGFFSKTKNGTGVGLFLCKVIIQEFNGKIFCDSVENEFTHFKICFPKI